MSIKGPTCQSYKQQSRLGRPLRDDSSPGEVGPLDPEAAVLQRLWQRVLQGDLCSQPAVLFGFTQDLQNTANA